MFNDAENFNSDISRWDTRNVVSMTGMFYGATDFNQNIGGWNIGMVTSMTDMFDGSGNNRPELSVENYSAILIGWANKTNTPDNLSFTAVTNRNTSNAQLYESARSAYKTLQDKYWVLLNIDTQLIFIPTPTTTTVLQFTNNEPMRNSIKIEGYCNNKLLYYAKHIK
jgi:surface protein